MRQNFSARGGPALGGKNRVEQYLERFFDLKIKKLRQVDAIAAELCEQVRDFTLNGGKRIRALLIEYGYSMAGGKNIKLAMKVAAAFEVIHSFLLIHDDVIDRSDIRRFHKTIHIQYQDKYKKLIKTDLEHFGNSMGILAGDLALSLAYEILDEVNKQIKDPNILRKINKIILQTIIGETLDVVYSGVYLGSRLGNHLCKHARKPQRGLLAQYSASLSPAKAGEPCPLGLRMVCKDNYQDAINAVNKIHLLKTAKYTIEGPLHIGALLNGASQKLLSQFSKFAIPLGIAFQIKDDIEGVFGDEEKVGKSVVSDIKEGKLTLLVIKALDKADEKQKKFLQKTLGNENITNKDLEKVKQIIVQTGALKYSQDKILDLTKKARLALQDLKLDREDFLNELIGFIQR